MRIKQSLLGLFLPMFNFLKMMYSDENDTVCEMYMSSTVAIQEQ